MRIAVVGATGNVGSAVLRELDRREEVTSVVAVARRLPDTEAEPYDVADWATIDIQFPESVAALAEAFDGADAVIHLAWLIQPNSERELLRRVNVDGTRHVLEAAVAAGVRRLAVASSVGAYSPVDDDEPRDEGWPTEGIPSSHYSVDKAAQERVVDEFEEAHPELSLARLRPGLIFQSSAGSEIQRYFAGRWTPVQLLGLVRPVMVPVPAAVRVHAVHADDVASAFVQATLRGAHGAFNIAAEDLLDADRLAKVVSGGRGRAVRVPATPVRSTMRAAHRAGVLPADEGWLDLALHAPVLDTTRARRELGWHPQRSAAEAADNLLRGMVSGEGLASRPMRPRSGPEPESPDLPASGHRLAGSIDAALLRQYLADHLTGATAGVKRIEAMAEAYEDTPVFPQISEVAGAIRREHAFLQNLMLRQGFPRPGPSASLAWAGEKLARLKPYGRAPLRRSPTALLLECELMSSAVTGKLHGWLVCREHAEELGVDPAVFTELIEDAHDQLETLREAHRHTRQTAFRAGMPAEPARL